MADLIRVLVVDDSAFVRKVVSQMLSRSPFIEVVGIARDGTEALEMAAELKPDVITLDLIMPRMDGVEFLRAQMAIRPIPVVICSITHESGEMAIAAFDAGAVECVDGKHIAAAAVEFDRLSQRQSVPVVKVGSRQRDVAEGGCTKTVAIVGIASHALPAEVADPAISLREALRRLARAR